MAFCSSSIETCVGHWFPQFCPDMQFPQASENTPASAQQAASGNAHVPPLHHEVAAAVPRAPGEAHAQQTGAQSSGSVQAVPGAPFFHDQLGGIDPTHVPVRPLAVAVHSYTCAPLIGVDVQAITPASSNDTTLLVVVVAEPSVVGVVGPVAVEPPQAVATTMKAMYFHELTRPRLTDNFAKRRDARVSRIPGWVPSLAFVVIFASARRPSSHDLGPTMLRRSVGGVVRNSRP
jgi:hypothetical protein